MQYLKKSFTVAPGRSKAFRDGHEKIDWSDAKKKPRIRVRKQMRPKTKAAG